MNPSTNLQPVLIGRYFQDGQSQFLPVCDGEMRRAAVALGRIVESFNFSPGRYVLSISGFDEVVQVVPFERAFIDSRLIVTNAEMIPFEARRVEANLRRFDIAAVIGLNRTILDALQADGHDPAQVFAGKVVWARPDAYAALLGIPNITLLRWVELGPAMGAECALGVGVHVDSKEWKLDEVDGEIRISSRLGRCLPIKDQPTGIRGRIDRSPCRCGNPDHRVIV